MKLVNVVISPEVYEGTLAESLKSIHELHKNVLLCPTFHFLSGLLGEIKEDTFYAIAPLTGGGVQVTYKLGGGYVTFVHEKGLVTILRMPSGGTAYYGNAYPCTDDMNGVFLGEAMELFTSTGVFIHRDGNSYNSEEVEVALK